LIISGVPAICGGEAKRVKWRRRREKHNGSSMPKAHITIPLDIPNVEVLKIETTEKNEYIITI
jgi:hypothetical protein